MFIKTFDKILANVFKATSTTEDALDVAKAKTTAWKVEAMKEVHEKLEGTDMKEVKDFYNNLYD